MHQNSVKGVYEDDRLILLHNDGSGHMSGAGVTLMRNMVAALQKHYPQHSWAVSVDEAGGVVQVRNLALSGRMGFLMKITSVDPEQRNVVRHAGELLERYRVARGKAVDLRDQIRRAERKINGEMVYDT